MECIAHRGFADRYPENTLGAVRAAERADLVEVDARRSADGEVVVVHDETVDRVTGTTGAVRDFTAEELAALDVLGSGEGVPMLASVCEALPADVGINVELKERGLAADVAAVLDGAGPDRVLVSSFDAGALREMREAGDWPLAYVFEEAPEAGLDRARDLGCAAVHPEWRLLDEGFVAAAREGDLAVNAWTVDDAESARRARRAGVDGLIADSPEFC
ncbi:glycerophosphodiester phosphodiesterase [Halomicrobium urmianum]|uniref:glycerophosphodiester phosphodiesterase n=1 Tax=Halomicrobium urmianum TaxID=1586233 RepID=UPI001CDA15B2|nr:glycerophosphodiester phosphodiesterase family protein [Halomicrobium urmianum]